MKISINRRTKSKIYTAPKIGQCQDHKLYLNMLLSDVYIYFCSFVFTERCFLQSLKPNNEAQPLNAVITTMKLDQIFRFSCLGFFYFSYSGQGTLYHPTRGNSCVSENTEVHCICTSRHTHQHDMRPIYMFNLNIHKPNSLSIQYRL